MRGLILLLLSLLATATLVPAAAAAETFDHSAFDALLRAHVVDGKVDYDAFGEAPSFPAYLDALARADLARLDEDERLAFWINVYNAYTIQLINRHQERDSIRNINKSLFGTKGPWREKLVKAAGEVHHLDNVEHDIIRKQFKEPRIHFALVCAALGCPDLRSEAYAGARLEAQLQEQSVRFLLRSPDRNRVEPGTRTVYGSPIYASWYREDFGQTDAAIGRYLARFHPEGPERQLLLSGSFKLVETDYDWTLNSREKAKAREEKGAP
ncbi:MAG TPA: DUF547 domain-containing protein, partial [Vicinamibacteria bacterium]|nr:DUF547 domain-containing protein [Vicinamibacteria bacterium]